jgi:Tfp pilus assembly protein PilN
MLLQEHSQGAPCEPLFEHALSDNPVADLASLVLSATDGSSLPPARGSLRVLVSDRWLRWLTLPWNDELLVKASAAAQYNLYAQMMFGDAAGELLYTSAYSVFGRPQCVAGIPADLMRTIRELAQTRNSSVESLRPLSVVSWERQCASIQDRTYAFAVTESTALTVLMIKDRRLEHVVSQSCDADPAGELAKLWRRMRLRDPGLAGVAKLYAAGPAGVMFDTSEHPEQPAPPVPLVSAAQAIAPIQKGGNFDFVARAAPVRGWRLGLLLAGLGYLAFGAAGALTEYTQAAALQEEISLSSPGSDSRPSGAVAEPQRMRAQIQSVNHAITSLNLPVGVLLRNLQPPGDLHTALLGLDLSDIHGDTRTAAVKITAASRSATDMTTYVDLLSRSPMFDAVYLTRHDVDATRAEHPYRYIVEASWKQ